ncbi:hypothetical protein MTR62_19185 [Novosphingobium sp. 1949]|uniref:Uncharacterized protein n=1 Tax=Novosphingobium organovorum TaxID=2930092 RepID=A0ABT0BIA0_9SPHN|nr:hypothetical protein [Novosphingobium organovorum]MCJ2184797.1 hypothetical protein [Novosphingobium organovorum]
MPVYQLHFAEDGVGLAQRLEFTASDSSEALIVAHKEAANRNAELWLGDTRLCAIRRNRAPVPDGAVSWGALVI